MSTAPSREMRALRAERTIADTQAAIRELSVVTLPVPELRHGQVLVRIHAAPCNPADLLYLTGRYGIDRPLPATPGFEGAGKVVASGGGMLGRWLVGKRVACGGHQCSGTWAEYCVARSTECLVLSKELSYEQGATALANPMTALAMIALAKKRGHRAIVQTAAAGQLGRMLAHLAGQASLAVLNVVRREAQAASLRDAGAEVLVSEQPGFSGELARRARELSATIAFDAVGGELTGQLVEALPPRSEVVLYGALSGQPCGAIDPMQLAFGHKSVRGFEIAAELSELGLLRAFALASRAQRLVSSGQVRTEIAARVPLDRAEEGLLDYARQMSRGKVLLTPLIADSPQ